MLLLLVCCVWSIRAVQHVEAAAAGGGAACFVRHQNLRDPLLTTRTRTTTSTIRLFGSKFPPPLDPTSLQQLLPEDDFFRAFRNVVPTQVQHFLRDSGLMRAVMDSSVVLAVPSIWKEHPSAFSDFLTLTRNNNNANSNSNSNSNSNYHWVQELFSSFRSKLVVDDSPTATLPHTANATASSMMMLEVNNVTVETLKYGTDKRQFISLLQPHQPISYQNDNNNAATNDNNKNRLVVFVHGGAWGSGFPSMYQLVAIPFLNRGFSVAIIGYRTFPSSTDSTTCTGQVDDLVLALDMLKERLPLVYDLSLLCHSSGAHIAALAFATGKLSNNSSNTSKKHSSSSLSEAEAEARARAEAKAKAKAKAAPINNHHHHPPQVDRLLLLAGVYDIPDHYQFEKSRGLERISPMAAACGDYNSQRRASPTLSSSSSPPSSGGSRSLAPSVLILKRWKENSPTRLFLSSSASSSSSSSSKQEQTTTTNLLPRLPEKTLILHGALDTTVPYTSSLRFAEAVAEGSKCRVSTNFQLLPTVGHADMIFHLMFGGETLNVVLDWMMLENESANQQK